MRLPAALAACMLLDAFDGYDGSVEVDELYAGAPGGTGQAGLVSYSGAASGGAGPDAREQYLEVLRSARSGDRSGLGQAYTTRNLEREDWWCVPHQRDALHDAFRMAGVTPQDIDVAQLYDTFTISVLLWLEHAGFCAEGEGGSFVEGGRIHLGGALPVNTAGGNLSESYMEGWLHIVEGVRQMRRACGPRQVADAELCLVTGRGMALNCANAMILKRG